MEKNTIADIRKEYTLQSLDENMAATNPFTQFEKWWKEASKSHIEEVNAMTLATCDTNGFPDARIVLLKGQDANGFVFYTNYNSSKSKQLLANPNCTLLFFWKEMERQIRISGSAAQISAAESIAYFDSRPAGSKIGAWASPQSLVVAGQSWLKETFDFYKERFSHGEIPKPPHWGGFRVVPQRIEFWQGRPSRMHDRILYTLQPTGSWTIERLAP